MNETEKLLVQIAGDIGALKQQGETQTAQIAELFKTVNALKGCQDQKVGEEKGKTDIIGRLLGSAGIIGSMIASYLASRGH